MNVVCVCECVCKAGEKASHRSLMTTVPSGVKNRTRILSCLLSLRSHCWAITCFLINASKHDSDRPIVSSTIAPSLLKSLRSAPLGCLFIQKYRTFFIPRANAKSSPFHNIVRKAFKMRNCRRNLFLSLSLKSALIEGSKLKEEPFFGEEKRRAISLPVIYLLIQYDATNSPLRHCV